MDISPAGASVPALPRRTGVSGALIRLGGAAIGVFAAVGGGYELVRLLIEWTDEFSFFVPFGGWQLDVMAAGLGVLLLALLVVSAIALLCIYRGLRGRTPNRRAVILAAFLPGLLLGGVAHTPMRSALSWASDHTAAAHHAIAEAQQFQADYRKAPPLVPLGGTAAAPALTARLLHPSDLGAGWYDGDRPNPSEISGGLQGQTLSVRSDLTQWHWTATMWSPGNIVLESLRRFDTPAAAKSYVATYGEQPKNGLPNPPNYQRGPTTQVRVGQVLVYEHGVQTGSLRTQGAAFVVGTDAFTVTTTGTSSTRDFSSLVGAAVRRATGGR